MSGHSDTETCPRCGGEMNCYTDWKPHDEISGDCFNCGFAYWTVRGVAPLDEVNELREIHDMEPLEELADPLPNGLSVSDDVNWKLSPREIALLVQALDHSLTHIEEIEDITDEHIEDELKALKVKLNRG